MEVNSAITRMDVSTKRVLRRKAVIMGEVVVFDGPFAYSALRQGLLTQRQMEDIFSSLKNRQRIGRFLEILEDVRPPAFEKLCYLLENQGYTWLCDELWVELICEKGNLQIEPHVIGEARQLVRQRLTESKKKKLDEKDIEELTRLIATRYQIAKDTLARQEQRLRQKKKLDREIVKDNVKDLCAQIERAMTTAQSRASSRVDNKASVSGHLTGYRSGEVLPRLTSAREENLNGWLTSLKSKISGLTNAYTQSKMQAERLRNKRRRKRVSSVVEENTATEQLEEEEFSESSSDDGGSELNADALDALAEAGMAKLRKKKPAGSRAPLHVKLAMPKFSVADSSKISSRSRADMANATASQKDKSNKRSVRIKSEKGRDVTSDVFDSDRDGRAKAKRRMKGKTLGGTPRGRDRRRSRRRKSDYTSEDDEEEFYLEGAERDVTKMGLNKDAMHLARMHKVAHDTRRARSGLARLDNCSKTEKLYWEKRVETMQRCRSVGYYYFLSEYKRDRCNACSSEPVPQRWDCAWWDKKVKEAAAAQGRHQSRPRGGPPKSDIFLNLYRDKSWNANDGAGKGATDLNALYDDENCPGACIIPGRKERRCLACAYANKEVPEFFDAMVSPSGAHHFPFPPLGKKPASAKVKQVAFQEISQTSVPVG